MDKRVSSDTNSLRAKLLDKIFPCPNPKVRKYYKLQLWRGSGLAGLVPFQVGQKSSCLGVFRLDVTFALYKMEMEASSQSLVEKISLLDML